MSTRSDVKRDPFADPDQTDRRAGRQLTILVVAVVVVIAVVIFVAFRAGGDDGPQYCGSRTSGLVKLGGECIGVTDGSYRLSPELADEEARIRQQNADIGTQRAVTVAVFDPLTPDGSSSLDIIEIQHQVQGAIVAQKWINEDAAATGSVRIRLVLANEGGHQTHWQPVVEQLNTMKHDKAPLVAVVGMGVSVQLTLDAAKKLSDYGIPAIGAITTADDLNQAAAPSFFRVLPATQDYVEALKPWAKQFSSALMVYDVASDDPQQPDLFTRSLRNDFRAAFRRPLKLKEVNFHGSENSKDVQPNRFGAIRNKICNEKVPLVLFAGRRNDLAQFSKALEGRECETDTPVTVMVGGTDLGGLVSDADLTEARVSLVWSAGSDISAWRAGQGAPPHFDRFLAAYQGVYGRGSLDDGEAMAGYDALLAAASAAQTVDDDPADDKTADDKTRPLPSGIDVRGALLNTSSLGAIPGAGGDLSFEERAGGRSGDPIGKLIPILQEGLPVIAPAGPVYLTK